MSNPKTRGFDIKGIKKEKTSKGNKKDRMAESEVTGKCKQKGLLTTGTTGPDQTTS